MSEHIALKLVNWASILEGKTRAQAVMTSEMPFIYPHMALMPDAHLGMGATVGSVIPTMGAIMPAAVGVDIGCGMSSVKTQFTEDDFRSRGKLSDLREEIERVIPMGKGADNATLTDSARARTDFLSSRACQVDFEPDKYDPDWRLQLGSLGSGNHFIEVTVDETGAVWLFLHSGSRGIGNRIATHHIKVAQKLMERWWIKLPDRDLAYLVEGTDEFWSYIREMTWAQEFARINRDEMMDRVVASVADWAGEDIERLQAINCHHNYTTKETHFGQDVWLTRKGAIDAAEDVWGLIPGSMGTASYVVQGKGNPLSLKSAPHGAGREFSRRKAKETFTMADLEKAMVGIEFRKTDAFIDEIPAAYKDVDVVMADAANLVTKVHTLHQILNCKGS